MNAGQLITLELTGAGTPPGGMRCKAPAVVTAVHYLFEHSPDEIGRSNASFIETLV